METKFGEVNIRRHSQSSNRDSMASIDSAIYAINKDESSDDEGGRESEMIINTSIYL